MTDRASSSELPVPVHSSVDVQSSSSDDSHEDDYHVDDSHSNLSSDSYDGSAIYFMNLSGHRDEDSVYLTKVTFDDKDDLTGDGREVLQKQLSSPVELSYRALHLLPVLDIDDDGIVSRAEIDSAAKDSKYKGTDAQVIAGLSEPSVWDRIANFSNDERGKETGISREDVWNIAERQDDVAVQSAYAAAIANYHAGEVTAGK